MHLPTILFSVDPGVRGAGVAHWLDGQLQAAAYVKNPATTGNGPFEAAEMARAIAEWRSVRWKSATDLVLEFPTMYGGRSSVGDARDLFPLAALDGALAALCPQARVKHYLPREWKQSTEKPKSTKEPYVIEGMVRRRLSEEELAVIEWPTNVKHTWDVADAIGIGLTALGRFEKARVYARE